MCEVWVHARGVGVRGVGVRGVGARGVGVRGVGAREVWVCKGWVRELWVHVGVCRVVWVRNQGKREKGGRRGQRGSPIGVLPSRQIAPVSHPHQHEAEGRRTDTLSLTCPPHVSAELV